LGTQGYWKIENPEDLLNKYNRRLGKAFVDGRFCVFAVIL
jgi:hypothetical protein